MPNASRVSVTLALGRRRPAVSSDVDNAWLTDGRRDPKLFKQRNSRAGSCSWATTGGCIHATPRRVQTTVSTGPLRLRLLGGFALEVDGQGVRIPSTAQRCLALLAVHRRPMPRALVAGTLWYRSDERRAQASLRSVVWRIRRAAASALTVDNALIGLGAGVTVDLHDAVKRAEGLVDGATLASDVQTEAEDRRVLELLPGWYEDWLLTEQEHFRQLQLQALEAQAADALERGDYGRAVRDALSALRSEPLRESACRLLVEGHLRSGNLAAAMEAYSAFEARLLDEVGFRVSPQLARLASDIRRNAPVTR